MTGSKLSLTSATTALTQPDFIGGARAEPVPGLVLAFSPSGLVADDRAALSQAPLTVGRSSACSWCLRDKKLSREHFRVMATGGGRFLLQDRGSRNGVFVDGVKVETSSELGPGSVVRAGGCLFVAEADLNALAPPDAAIDEALMAGRFHTFALLRRLKVAARAGHPVLLEGESGVGKELAAQALHRFSRELGRADVFQAHNAACYAGEDDAVSNLFGVTRGAFTGVEARAGALELSDGGTLFLDELHALPLRVQRSLLRFVEDGLTRPLGQPPSSRERRLDARLIFGTNIDVDRACDLGQLAHDLVARLDRVHLAPLRERRADIPSLFVATLRRALSPATAETLIDELRADLMEQLCCHDYRKGNVRELVKAAGLLAARLAEGEPATSALPSALGDALSDPPPQAARRAPPQAPRPPADTSSSSSYEQHREEILAVYHDVGGNLSRMEALLKSQGIPCTRRWLAVFLDRWGVRPIPKRR